MPHIETQAQSIIPDAPALSPPPVVSIVMPAYNVAPYIRETLDSVFAQTFTGYELIIINDGSPDTLELEQELAPVMQRIRYLKQENRGAGAARNEGVRSARGEFIAFLDADDLWLPDYLSEQLAFIRSRECDLVYADALIFGDSPLSGRTFMETSPSSGAVTFQSLINSECNIITSGVLARRQTILDAGLFDEQLRNSQDFELWLRMVRRGARADYQRKVLLRYRCHENSLSGDEINRINRELRVLGKIESTYDLTPDEETQVAEAIIGIRANLELETGKIHLAKGEYVEARQAFSRAGAARPNLKLRIALWLLKIVPGLLRRFYLRRATREGES